MVTHSQRFLIISYFTNDEIYRECAETLKSSLIRFGIEFEIDEIADRGDWEKNAAYKAEFMQSKWDKSDAPIVWLDADATLESIPSLFSELDCDFAAHKWQGWQLAGGTLYFGKTDAAKAASSQVLNTPISTTTESHGILVEIHA